jgi:hypothetical protein
MFTQFASVGKRPLVSRVVSLFFMLCLVVGVAFFTGCDTDGDDEFVDDNQLKSSLVGTWKYAFPDNAGYESYSISNTSTLTKTEDWGGGPNVAFSGIIVHVSNFSDTAGVIIIKYESGKEKQWYSYDSNYNATLIPRTGDFYGIYFTDLTASTVKLADTADTSHNYGPTETATLNQAISKFTAGAVGNFVDWSVVQAQAKQP